MKRQFIEKRYSLLPKNLYSLQRKLALRAIPNNQSRHTLEIRCGTFTATLTHWTAAIHNTPQPQSNPETRAYVFLTKIYTVPIHPAIVFGIAGFYGTVIGMEVAKFLNLL